MSGKIRNLLDDPLGDVITLKRLIYKLTACAKELSELEVKNTKVALKNAKVALKEFKRDFIELELRISTTITQEVLTEVTENTKNGIVYGNPNKLVRKISKNNQIELDKAASLRMSDLELERERIQIQEEKDNYFD